MTHCWKTDQTRQTIRIPLAGVERTRGMTALAVRDQDRLSQNDVHVEDTSVGKTGGAVD